MAKTPANVTRLDPVPELKEGEVFLCVGLMCWGKGKTVEAAKKVAKSNNPRDGLSEYAVFLTHQESTVSPVDGTISYPLKHGKPVEVERKRAKKR